jgi:hypothetical protein
MHLRNGTHYFPDGVVSVNPWILEVGSKSNEVIRWLVYYLLFDSRGLWHDISTVCSESQIRYDDPLSRLCFSGSESILLSRGQATDMRNISMNNSDETTCPKQSHSSYISSIATNPAKNSRTGDVTLRITSPHFRPLLVRNSDSTAIQTFFWQ